MYLYEPLQKDQKGHLQSQDWLPMGLVSDLLISKLWEFDVFHDTEYHYWNQVFIKRSTQ